MDNLRDFFDYDVNYDRSVCNINHCGRKLKGKKCSNLKRHLRRFHKEKHLQIQALEQLKSVIKSSKKRKQKYPSNREKVIAFVQENGLQDDSDNEDVGNENEDWVGEHVVVYCDKSPDEDRNSDVKVRRSARRKSSLRNKRLNSSDYGEIQNISVKEESANADILEEIVDISKDSQLQEQIDECSLYGQLLAFKLRTLDEKTRTIVTNQIDNLVFKAQMKNYETETIEMETTEEMVTTEEIETI